ncbi:hypothetical protein Unana1_04270 [Umbelopsis nana]
MAVERNSTPHPRPLKRPRALQLKQTLLNVVKEIPKENRPRSPTYGQACMTISVCEDSQPAHKDRNTTLKKEKSRSMSGIERKSRTDAAGIASMSGGVEAELTEVVAATLLEASPEVLFPLISTRDPAKTEYRNEKPIKKTIDTVTRRRTSSSNHVQATSPAHIQKLVQSGLVEEQASPTFAVAVHKKTSTSSRVSKSLRSSTLSAQAQYREPDTLEEDSSKGSFMPRRTRQRSSSSIKAQGSPVSTPNLSVAHKSFSQVETLAHQPDPKSIETDMVRLDALRDTGMPKGPLKASMGWKADSEDTKVEHNDILGQGTEPSSPQLASPGQTQSVQVSQPHSSPPSLDEHPSSTTDFLSPDVQYEVHTIYPNPTGTSLTEKLGIVGANLRHSDTNSPSQTHSATIPLDLDIGNYDNVSVFPNPTGKTLLEKLALAARETELSADTTNDDHLDDIPSSPIY